MPDIHKVVQLISSLFVNDKKQLFIVNKQLFFHENFFLHNCNFPQLCIATQIPCGFHYKSGKTITFSPEPCYILLAQPIRQCAACRTAAASKEHKLNKLQATIPTSDKCPLKRTRSIYAANLNRKEDRGATKK